MSDQVVCRQRLAEYGWRMDIDEGFRDDQSGGFDMEHTCRHDPDRLERLLLALAIATCGAMNAATMETHERNQSLPGYAFDRLRS